MMTILKSILGIVWENTTPCTELPRDFCAGIGPLQLGVVLVFFIFDDPVAMHCHYYTQMKILTCGLLLLLADIGQFLFDMRGMMIRSMVAKISPVLYVMIQFQHVSVENKKKG